MEHYLKCAEVHEREIYQQYVNKCKMFYISAILAVFFTSIGFIFGPIITPDQLLPIEANYPFDVKHEPMKSIVYLHQCIAIWQCFSNVCHSSLIGLLIWFTTARFEILSNHFRSATNLSDVITGIREHIKLLR